MTTLPEELITIIPADVAHRLIFKAGLAQYRTQHRGEHWRTDETLLALSNAAHRWQELTARGQNRAPTPDNRAVFGRMTTRQAGDRLGLSARTVRRAITAGRIPADLVAGTYLMTRDDVDRYRKARGE